MKRRGKRTGKFRSKFEAAFAAWLDKRGIPYDYENHKFQYTLTKFYTPDFELSNGIFIECKGYLDSDSRRNYKNVKNDWPDIDLRFVFQRAANRIRKGSAITYGDWAESIGCKWSEGCIPLAWTKEKTRTTCTK